jgi:hypothetical protein
VGDGLKDVDFFGAFKLESILFGDDLARARTPVSRADRLPAASVAVGGGR